MNVVQATLEHKVIPPRHIDAERQPTLLLLHGRGADENDLLGLVDFLDDRLLVISVRAPYPFPWSGGYTWYDILEVGTPEPKMFSESYGRLIRFVEYAKQEYAVDPRKLFLLGFSMGTVMSYSLLLTKPEWFAGVIANSGYIPEGTELNFRLDGMKTKSILITHGIHDPVIPVHLARRAKELLEKSVADLTYKEYPMGHQISEESLRDMSRWLSQRIDRRD